MKKRFLPLKFRVAAFKKIPFFAVDKMFNNMPSLRDSIEIERIPASKGKLEYSEDPGLPAHEPDATEELPHPGKDK